MTYVILFFRCLEPSFAIHCLNADEIMCLEKPDQFGTILIITMSNFEIFSMKIVCRNKWSTHSGLVAKSVICYFGKMSMWFLSLKLALH